MEDMDACEKGELNKSSIAEHAWTLHHLLCEETSGIDREKNGMSCVGRWCCTSSNT